MSYDVATDGYVKVEGGYVTPEATVTYTVDPTMKSKIENYTLTPADGSAIKSLRVVYVNFPDVQAYDMTFQSEDEPAITFTNGQQTVNCMFGNNWDCDRQPQQAHHLFPRSMGS